MKILLATSAVILLCSMPATYAQDTGPKNDNSIHQSAGDRDSRGTPKYYQSSRHHYHHYRHPHYSKSHRYMRAGGASGPTYDKSIHQSAGERDSRGNPKYNQEKKGN